MTRAKAFFDWRHQVLAGLERDVGLRLAVIEVGCGLRVPSVRKRGAGLVAEAPRGQVMLVRSTSTLCWVALLQAGAEGLRGFEGAGKRGGRGGVALEEAGGQGIFILFEESFGFPSRSEEDKKTTL